jgi:hypothetical protein
LCILLILFKRHERRKGGWGDFFFTPTDMHVQYLIILTYKTIVEARMKDQKKNYDHR